VERQLEIPVGLQRKLKGKKNPGKKEPKKGKKSLSEGTKALVLELKDRPST